MLENMRFQSVRTMMLVDLWRWPLVAVILALLRPAEAYAVRQTQAEQAWSFGGCFNQNKAVPVTGHVVACGGEWEGTIDNAGHLCASGYKVCSHHDTTMLAQIPWSVATTVSGCYAFNAAHDGDRCNACKNNDESDDLAAIGRDCPHRTYGKGSCLDGGRIDASCCVDALQNRACQHVPNITTGVLCCREELQEFASDGTHSFAANLDAVMAPAIQMVLSVGERAELHCPLVRSGSELEATLDVQWMKNGVVLADITDAHWSTNFSQPEHSGLYSCSINVNGQDAFGHINLTVNTVQSSGCHDGTSEGFHEAHDVQGCAGAWKGHVKKGTQQLCAQGWRVCTPRDKPFLDQIDPVYLSEFGGCFAYNAGYQKQKCQRSCLPTTSMAALGSDCPAAVREIDTSHACYLNRMITAYATPRPQPARNAAGPGRGNCAYREGAGVTGVLCCRRSTGKKKKISGEGYSFASLSPPAGDESLECYPRCRNGGTCMPDGRCLCPSGFFGHACQHGGCTSRCQNGGKCFYGYCKCYGPFYGTHCQFSRIVDMAAQNVDSEGTQNAENSR